MNRLLHRRWFVASGAVAVGAALFTTWRKTELQSTNDPKHDRSPHGLPLAVDCTSSDSPTSQTVVSRSQTPSGVQVFTNEQVRKAVERSRKLVKRTMLEQGIPGAVVAVSKDGKTVWSEGLGYSDVENNVLCTPETVMRIASISKPLTTVALLQLCQKGLVDLDAPVQTYVPEFPRKEFQGKPVDVTTRQLLSHMAGVRHYRKKPKKNGGAKDGDNVRNAKSEFDSREYFIQTHYNSVEESLRLFAEDDLLYEPGTKYHYTTYGWTLLSSVIEKASGEKFLDYMRKNVFEPLGMAVTRGEFHEPLVYNRARYYVRPNGGQLKNTRYVDNSHKWAGGGLISNADDLLRFGNAMIVSYQLGKLENIRKSSQDSEPLTGNASEGSRCLLDGSTTAMMWEPIVEVINPKTPQLGYGMGWIVRRGDPGILGGQRRLFCVGHTGGSVGASSALVVIPQTKPDTSSSFVDGSETVATQDPEGVSVALIFNLQEVKGMFSLGVKIAEEFV